MKAVISYFKGLYSGPFQAALVFSFTFVAAITIGVGTWVISRTINSYLSTAMAERGVGCEACHGPMADHNAWQAKHPNQTGDPTVRKISREEMFSACAQCHSRRGELTGDFRPPENFFDHHLLSIPDETDLFYPDGQIRDEDYEVTAFLGSKAFVYEAQVHVLAKLHTRHPEGGFAEEAARRPADRPLEFVPGTEPELGDEPGRNEEVVVVREIAVLAAAHESCAPVG